MKSEECYGEVKRVTRQFSATCRRCGWNITEAVEKNRQLCIEVETVREFTYLGDRLSAGGECEEAAVTVRTRC